MYVYKYLRKRYKCNKNNSIKIIKDWMILILNHYLILFYKMKMIAIIIIKNIFKLRYKNVKQIILIQKI